MNNYVEIPKFLMDIKKEEIDDAVANRQFIICNLQYPEFQFMKILVVDPSIKEIDRMRAIFRTMEDARIFSEASTLKN